MYCTFATLFSRPANIELLIATAPTMPGDPAVSHVQGHGACAGVAR
jgi:hypothetical protein